jgi:hypothetical protein
VVDDVKSNVVEVVGEELERRGAGLKFRVSVKEGSEGLSGEGRVW